MLLLALVLSFACPRILAAKVSNGLMEAKDLSDIFSKYLQVTTVISNDEMYQVVGENS